MTDDEKLAAILAAVQTDPGNRGLARDSADNLFTACPGDFASACRSMAGAQNLGIAVVTGFFIPSASPPAFETDGPLGAAFLARSLIPLGATLYCGSDEGLRPLFDRLDVPDAGRWHTGIIHPADYPADQQREADTNLIRYAPITHLIALERAGPATDGRPYSMRGRDIAAFTAPAERYFRTWPEIEPSVRTIGIGDGGNEIGMGKIPHETVVKNIPNGDLIHCRVPTDYLIVAGVSNWGAYALAAGVFVLRGVKPPPDLFDPDRERAILEVMVREGPLVDGVTGKQTATVDGLSWEEYARPLVRIREILES